MLSKVYSNIINTTPYPVCYNSFKQWLLFNKTWYNIYINLGSPKPFDVSLRDGLQGLTKEQQNEYTLDKKIELYNKIMIYHEPNKIEIGSIVSEKVLPVFKDTIELNRYIFNKNYNNNTNVYESKSLNYILVPNQLQLLKILNHKEADNFSFITSVSESFQKKNTKLSLEENDKDLLDMMYLLDDHLCHKTPLVKLYVSCINECPIEGKIDNDLVVKRISKLYDTIKPNTICLSDTCGTLTSVDFEYIVDRCYYYGVPFSKLSLHLHVKDDRVNEVENIIHKALDRKIVDYDVSILDTGGCSVTMEKKNLAPNLSYEQYYKFLVNYILKISEQIK